RNAVWAELIVLLVRRPWASYWKLATLPPAMDARRLRASQVYVLVPSLVRLPLRSYVSATFSKVTCRLAASYVALVMAEGKPVRAQVPPRTVLLPAASWAYVSVPRVTAPSLKARRVRREAAS